MQIAPGIYRVESEGEVVYALDCGGAYALVDVGSGPALAEKLEQLRSDGIAWEKIVAVFLTHNHPDHCQALERVKQELAPRVVVHRLATERLAHCPASEPLAPDLVDYTVDEGDGVEIGDIKLEVFHLPGHTADSTAWQLGDDLFVGDIIFYDGGIGWMDVHWGSCVGDYRVSLQRLSRLTISAIYPGHGDYGPLKREMIDEALRRITVLSEADGSPLAALGRPAPRRHSDEPSKLIRLSASPSA